MKSQVSYEGTAPAVREVVIVILADGIDEFYRIGGKRPPVIVDADYGDTVHGLETHEVKVVTHPKMPKALVVKADDQSALLVGRTPVFEVEIGVDPLELQQRHSEISALPSLGAVLRVTTVFEEGADLLPQDGPSAIDATYRRLVTNAAVREMQSEGWQRRPWNPLRTPQDVTKALRESMPTLYGLVHPIAQAAKAHVVRRRYVEARMLLADAWTPSDDRRQPGVSPKCSLMEQHAIEALTGVPAALVPEADQDRLRLQVRAGWGAMALADGDRHDSDTSFQQRRMLKDFAGMQMHYLATMVQDTDRTNFLQQVSPHTFLELARGAQGLGLTYR